MEVMEERGSLPSALEVGVGVGVGFGLASDQSAIRKSIRSDPVSRLIADQIKQGLLRIGEVTFNEFLFHARVNGSVNAMAVGEASGEPEKSGLLTKKESEYAAPQKEVLPDNEFEERIREQVICRCEIGVTFENIGAWEETKELLERLVLLPLRRPKLFKNGLLKPCRGILLFGPLGTRDGNFKRVTDPPAHPIHLYG